jgi:2',3'-cyclic-nucleotide 2'-phosphodiesterase (5'-nucleotidase family)
MKFLLKLLLLVVTGTFFYAGMLSGPALHAAAFTIIYSNDVLGELELCGCDEEQLGGLSRKASVIHALKKEGRPLLILDAGNLFFKEKPGTAIEQKEFLLKSEYILDAYRQIGCDALNVGETDLLLGLAHLQELKKKAQFPFLSANLVDKKSGKPLFDQFIIKNIAGIKVGIIGLFSNAGIIDPALTARDPVAAAKKTVADIRQRVSMIIVLSNLGIEQDRVLAREVSGIDIIMGGRATARLPEPVKEGKTMIVQAYNRGQYLGKIEVSVASAPVSLRDTLMPLTENIPDDKAVSALTKEYRSTLIAMNRIEFFKEQINGKKNGVPGETSYAGAEKCAACHQPQYDNWLNTAHSQAYDTLMKNCNHFDIECLPCHTTGFKEPGGYTIAQGENSPFLHVQCESCHGPGKRHKGKGDIMRNPEEGICKQCHDEKNSPRFNYSDYLPIVKCPVTPK